MALTLAIKPGTTHTLIYVAGHGLVLKEPTLTAFDGKSCRRVRAVGYEALAMRGKAPGVNVISPIREGIVVEPEIFTLMLKEYIGKIFENNVFKPRLRAIVSIPLGLTLTEREMYEDALIEAGIGSVTLVPGVILSAIGADMPVGTGKGMLNINMGGGRTDIALISYGGIINGCGVGIGGGAFDKAIVDYLVGKYGIRISFDAAKKLREDIGSLYDNDISNQTVSGMDINSNVPEFATVYALDIRDVIKPYLSRICDLTKTIIKSCPADIANDLMEGGISLTGGVSNMPGIKEFFMKTFDLPVKSYENPEYLQIVGAGKLISDDKLLEELVNGGSV